MKHEINLIIKRITLRSLLLFTSISYGQWTQIGGDINGAAVDDNSGYSVSLSADGNIVAIGSPFNGKAGEMAGLVRVYKIENGVWTQLGSDILGEKEYDTFGHSVSLSADGKRLAAGAQFGTGQAFGNGRTFEFVNGDWIQLGQTIIGEQPGDESGYSVVLSADGNTFALGAINNDGNGSSSGHVRVHKLDSILWSYIGRDLNGAAPGDQAGTSIALSSDGNIIAIGSIGNDYNGSNSGQVRVYQLNGTKWNQMGKDLNGEGANDIFGSSVSLSSDGKTLAAGALGNDSNGSNSGHTRIYQFIDTSWVQVGADIDGEASGDQSGVSVSLSSDGSKVAIGANMNDGRLSNSGHVRVFQLENGVWKQIGADINGEAPGDQSGVSVSLSADGSTIAIGANGNDGNGGNSGQVRVYKYNTVISTTNVSQNIGIEISPNPVTDFTVIRINGFDGTKKDLKIHDLTGAVVLYKELDENQNTLLLNTIQTNLPSGYYSLSVTGNKLFAYSILIVSNL